ncbi:iron uptake transporter permease EfeU [Novosphingobium resinovorum]|uniref:iron uptake transporter permease EfeU n=1 Tax=Novosphingobium resinovorum TaxID=158500 RepID=UPI002ED32258|nr:iron uptake transporter permease EfeU [Novosphingobium resinovorum]
MLVPFLVMVREGIEAALIVGIVSSYLHHARRRDMMPAVWVGVLLASALSLFAGAALQMVAAEFPQKQQELFEGIVGLVAVVMLTSMVFWMRRAARSIKGELHASLDRALARESGPAWALIGMVFLAVAREGLESVFFLLAIFQQSQGWEAPVGALAGIAVSVVVGIALHKGGIRLDLRRFFRFTGVFILLVAAGLLAGVLRKFHEAGIWNGLQGVVVDLSEALPMDGPVGAVLAGLLGYQAVPVVGEVIVYVVFLVVSLFWFFRPAAAPSLSPAGANR